MKIYELSHRGRGWQTASARIGEVVFERWLEHHGVRFDWLPNTQYDYRIAEETVEVKTKDRTVKPLPGYDASVPDYNVNHQRPDWYAFLSLLRTGSDGALRDYRRAYPGRHQPS